MLIISVSPHPGTEWKGLTIFSRRDEIFSRTRYSPGDEIFSRRDEIFSRRDEIFSRRDDITKWEQTKLLGRQRFMQKILENVHYLVKQISISQQEEWE
jgi:hypothetical protein